MSAILPNPRNVTASASILASTQAHAHGSSAIGIAVGIGPSSIVNSNNTAWTKDPANISMQGNLTLNGENPDILIGKKSMAEWMEKVEKRLSILVPKPELLEKYEALQHAYSHYKTLEALLHGTENDKD
jgi:hypothetical protein